MLKKMPRLALPSALAVSVLLTTAACSDDDETEELAACSSIQQTTESGHCVTCRDDDGGIDCAGSPGCFYDEGEQRCDEEIA